jgi:hypothetical protein
MREKYFKKLETIFENFKKKKKKFFSLLLDQYGPTARGDE